MRRILGLLDLVVPPTCAACRLPGAAICPWCADAIAPPAPIGCARCGHPWAVATPACAECPPALDALRFAAVYLEPVPAIMGALKDRGRRELARHLAHLITERCDAPSAPARLVPVPLTRGREAERGFNQAALIAAHLGRAWEREVVPLLTRVRDDRPQRGASATERAANVRGAFAVPAGMTTPSEVWIVDDVCTTGATLSACARVLRRAGATNVGALCVARVLRHSPGV